MGPAKRNTFDGLWFKLASLLVSSAVAVLLLLLFLPQHELPHPPKLVALAGGFDDVETVPIRYQPYSWLRQFYPSNPRGYFSTIGPGGARMTPWRIEHNEEATAIPQPTERSFPFTIEIVPAVPDPVPWSVALKHPELRLRAGFTGEIRLRIASDAPREIGLLFLDLKSPSQPAAIASETISAEGKEIVLQLPPAVHERVIVPTINLGGSAGRVTVESLTLNPSANSATPAIQDDFFLDYHVNRWGYRNRDVPLEAPEGTIRVACLGDSFTFGQGVRDDDAYPRVLETLLRAEFPAKRLEVLNFGVMGIATDAQRFQLERDVERFSPDLVVVTLCWNDAILQSEDDAIQKVANSASAPTEYFQACRRAIEEHGFRHCIAELKRIHAYCRSRGQPLVVGLFNSTDASEDLRMAKEVLPAMKAEGIPAFDIRAELERAGCFAKDSMVHACDGHPNEKAQAVYGWKLAQFVSEEIAQLSQSIEARSVEAR